MTPSVYQHEAGDDWLVKHDLNKIETEGIRERAAYVLENIVTILLARQANRKATKWVHSYRRNVLRVKPKTNVYSKADRTSDVAAVTSDDLKEIGVDYATPGLKGDGYYWRVLHFGSGDTIDGFISADDINSE
jgi:hypothetical protein